ncbi:uncharacterized protein LOC127240003 isoform X2 [Andrographis paniculata]|uniref:uncharacterized protein LOC127240003 isoform X2 n=1 Tax=Andrographis paniculata TaxID=175694 RepID=UPI0021E7EE7C|nr:uncharacterized protein LOC127240003 isoform X2 [Andrographis paniculata]
MAYRGLVLHEGSISQLLQELSPSTPCFVHVLHDADFSQSLHLPASFAPRVEHLVGVEVLLEDICGQIWPVTLSYVENTLSFAEGWKKFHRSHDLEKGCSLVFSYVKEGHFFVQVYDPSGCERTCFIYPMRLLNNDAWTHAGVVSNIPCGNDKAKRNDKGKEPIIGRKRGFIDLDGAPFSASHRIAKLTPVRPMMPPPGFNKPIESFPNERNVALGLGSIPMDGEGGGSKEAQSSQNRSSMNPSSWKAFPPRPPGF